MIECLKMCILVIRGLFIYYYPLLDIITPSSLKKRENSVGSVGSVGSVVSVDKSEKSPEKIL